jgi:hypothetical protein
VSKRITGNYNGTIMCNSCHRAVSGSQYLTEVNPPGGYGREQVLVCDDCMASDEWAHWRSRKWPNWPATPIDYRAVVHV